MEIKNSIDNNQTKSSILIIFLFLFSIYLNFDVISVLVSIATAIASWMTSTCLLVDRWHQTHSHTNTHTKASIEKNSGIISYIFISSDLLTDRLDCLRLRWWRRRQKPPEKKDSFRLSVEINLCALPISGLIFIFSLSCHRSEMMDRTLSSRLSKTIRCLGLNSTQVGVELLASASKMDTPSLTRCRMESTPTLKCVWRGYVHFFSFFFFY